MENFQSELFTLLEQTQKHKKFEELLNHSLGQESFKINIKTVEFYIHFDKNEYKLIMNFISMDNKYSAVAQIGKCAKNYEDFVFIDFLIVLNILRNFNIQNFYFCEELEQEINKRFRDFAMGVFEWN